MPAGSQPLVAANVQDAGVALASGVEGVIDDVAVLVVVQVDDDEVRAAGAGGLVLCDTLSRA
jgi:hypothetical protein